MLHSLQKKSQKLTMTFDHFEELLKKNLHFIKNMKQKELKHSKHKKRNNRK